MQTKNSFTKTYAMAALLGMLLLGCFALSPNAQGVLPPPPPDGGYPGNNTAEGQQALISLTTGVNNTALGYQTLYHNTTGSYNNAEGSRALFINTTGTNNTANGAAALYNNTIGKFNVADGFSALISNSIGNANTAAGYRALYHNTTGSNNIALGVNAGFNLTTGNNNIDIGSVGVAGESGIIRIGTNGTHTNTFLTENVMLSGTDPRLVLSGGSPGSAAVTYASFGNTFFAGLDPSDGDFKIQDQGASLVFINIDDGQSTTNFIGLCGQTNASFPIEVSNAGNTTNGNGAHLTGAGVWTDASSRTFKENFKPVDKVAVLKKVTELPVRTWTYKGVPGVKHMGPVAEDFKDTFGLGEDERYLASLDSNGVALAAIQGLNEVVKEKDKKIQDLEDRLSRLEKMWEKTH